MRPSFRKPGDDVAKRVEERVKTEVESKIKTEVDKRVSELLKEREEKEKAQKVEKLKAAVDVAKAIKGESEKESVEKAEKENKEKKDDLLCPTCHTGHLHKMEQSGLSVKCVGDKCGKEYVLLDTQADYQCKNCGIPIKKPDDPKSIDSCPYCGSKKAIKFDWSKVRDVARNVGR